VITRLGVDAVRAGVEELATGHAPPARASITDLEVGFAARTAVEFDVLTGALEAFQQSRLSGRISDAPGRCSANSLIADCAAARSRTSSSRPLPKPTG
jgi:hypothetical protein